MTRTRSLTLVLAGLLPLAAVAAQSGCTKTPPEDTTPSAVVAPPPPPPPTAVAIMPEEDAGAPDASDAGDGGPHVVGTGGAMASISKCCAALAQNANSAPPEQKGAYMAAAGACNGLRGMPVAQQAFGQIRAFLMGAKMPGACQ